LKGRRPEMAAELVFSLAALHPPSEMEDCQG
jgi:hypothetical protein